jgi:hypothetical protein
MDLFIRVGMRFKKISNGYISTCKFPGTNHLVVTTIMKVRLLMNQWG